MAPRRRVAVVLVLLFLVSLSHSAYSQSTGMTGKSVSGCTCHSNSGGLSPSMNGLPFGAGGYTPGATYSLQWDGGPHVSGDGGFNLDVSAGSWTNLGAHVKLQNGELTHSSDAARSWTADWVAPATGTGDVDFTVAVLYANGNGQNTGDTWGTGAWTLGEAGSAENTAPVISNVTYVPTSPTKATGLSVSYDFHDADGDSEQGTQIKWWRDGLQVATINDLHDVPNSWLGRGQQWQVEGTPSDGTEDGDAVMLNPVTIGNTPPIARELEVSPSDPINTDDLVLDYEYFDLDGNTQQDTVTQWYLDGARIPELDDSSTVSSLWTRSGDEWQASVRPHDGTDYGETVWTGVIVIGSSNTQPSATAFISPSGNVVTTDALQVIVGYSDPDGDDKESTEIRWMMNNDGDGNFVQISAYNDLNWVPPEATTKGQTWVAEAKVSDGLMWSDWVTSNAVTIQNTPPVVTSISMLPEGDLITTMNLTVEWEQSDIDGDESHNSQIRWWVDGEWKSEYDNLGTIWHGETIRDQHWSVQVIPGDGEDLGTSMKTNARAIQNAAPDTPEINLGGDFSGSIGVPDSLHDLIVEASSEDPDEEIVLFDYRWSRNGFHVPDLDGLQLVPASRLEPGQLWTVTVFANDPWGLSSSASQNITIPNLPPVAFWSTSPQPPIPGAMASFDASGASDPDGEIVTWFWTIDGVGFTGQSVDVLLAAGVHTVSLTVIDDMGGSDTIENEVIFGPVITVSSLSASLDGSTVHLSWTGSSSEYSVYRSTSPITTVVGLTSMDATPAWGEPVPIDMEPVGVTSDTTWSETAPVASMLYYAVTTVIDGYEVVWIVDGENMVSVNATAAASSIDTDPTGSPKLLVIPVAALLLLLGAAAIGITLFESRRRGA